MQSHGIAIAAKPLSVLLFPNWELHSARHVFCHHSLRDRFRSLLHIDLANLPASPGGEIAICVQRLRTNAGLNDVLGFRLEQLVSMLRSPTFLIIAVQAPACICAAQTLKPQKALPTRLCMVVLHRQVVNRRRFTRTLDQLNGGLLAVGAKKNITHLDLMRGHPTPLDNPEGVLGGRVDRAATHAKIQ